MTEGQASFSALEEQLSTHCRRWLLHAENLVRACQRQQPQPALFKDTANAQVPAPPSTGSAASQPRPATASPNVSPTSSLLIQLYQQGLQDACQAFIDFSVSTRWHLQLDPTEPGAASSFTAQLRLHLFAYEDCVADWTNIPCGPIAWCAVLQCRHVSHTTWWMIIDSGLLHQTGEALRLVRVPHVTTGYGRHEAGQPHQHVLRVGPFHETLLKACSVIISGVALAPLELWRPLLEQLLEPRANGFILLLTDVLGALCQVAPNKPLLFRDPQEDKNLGPPTRRGPSVRLDPQFTADKPRAPAPLPPHRPWQSAGGAALGTPPAHAPAAFSGFQTLPDIPSHTHLGSVFGTAATAQAAATPDTPSTPSHAPNAPRGRSPVGRDPSFSRPAATDTHAPALQPLPPSPAGHTATPVPVLRLSGISAGGVMPRGPTPTVASVPPDPGTLDPTAQPEPHVSRDAALTALQVLRDVNELASLEMSIRRGSVGVLNGMASIRRFLESLVDLRAGLAGALNHLGVLGHLANMYRTSADLCMTREELFPVLEGIVAIACHASSPDLPAPGQSGRSGAQRGDIRVYASALQPDIVALLTDELHQVLSGVSAQVRARAGEAFHQLPIPLQAQLSLLRHICECLIIFGAAPLPAHHTPHASDLLAQQMQAQPDGLQKVVSGAEARLDVDLDAPPSPDKTTRSSTLARRSVLRSASRSANKLRGSMGDDQGGEGGSNLDTTPLTRLVKNLLATVKLFSSFAACDVPFFCAAADCWLPTVKAMSRRLASEGHADLVEMMTLTLCEAACTMTTAMNLAGAAAAESDAAVQAKITERLNKQMAGGLLLDHSVEAEVYLRLGRRRGHRDRPYGWGAGAPAAGRQWSSQNTAPGDLRTPGHDGDMEPPDTSPRGDTDRGPSNHASPRDRLTRQTSVNSSVGPGSVASSLRTPRNMGVTALLPMALRSNGGSSRGSTSQLMTPRSDGEGGVVRGPAARGRLGSPEPHNKVRKSELAALWAALGYNAEGAALDAVAVGADMDETDVSLSTWPGLPKHFVSHYEEGVGSFLAAPNQWPSPRSPSSPTRHSTTLDIGLATASTAPTSPGMTPGGTGSSSPGKARRGGAVPPVVSFALGNRLFKPGAATALEEGDVMGDVPSGVRNLMEAMNRAGLLQAVENVFLAELLTDQMYRDHLAAVDASLLADMRAKGGSTTHLDKLRLTAVRLARDLLSFAPQMVSDRHGVHMLRAVRKFFSFHLQPQQQHVALAHPLSKFTATPPHFQLPSSLSLPRAPAHVLSSHSDLADLDTIKASWSQIAKDVDTHGRQALHAQEWPGCKMHTAQEVLGLTTYCTTSLVSISLELLPLPRIAATRAAADLAPGPGRGAAWVPSPLKVLGAGLLVMHTWPQILLLLRTLLRTLKKDTFAQSAAQRAEVKQRSANQASPTVGAGNTTDPVPGRDTLPRTARSSQDTALSRSTRTLAPFVRLLEAWLQQSNQLLDRFPEMEVLRSCVDTALLHGGVDSLIWMLVDGQHFTLASRAQKHQNLQSATLVDGVISGWRVQSFRGGIAHGARRPANELRNKATRQREIDREYGLSGICLVSLEELLCLAHEFCTPALSGPLVLSGAVRALEEATVAVHNRHTVVVSMLRAIAAAHLLALQEDEAETETRSTSPQSKRSVAVGLDRSPSLRSPTRVSRPRSSPAHKLDAFTATDLARIRSQAQVLTEGARSRHHLMFAEQSALRRLESLGDAPPLLEGWGGEVEESEEGDLHDEGPGDRAPEGPIRLASSVCQSQSQSQSPRFSSVRAPDSGMNKLASPSFRRAGSVWNDAALATLQEQALGSPSKACVSEEGALDLAMPRAGHWLLLASSIVRKATCGVAVAVSQLAAMKLSTGAVGARAERYTTGSNPAAATHHTASSPTRPSMLDQDAGSQRASSCGSAASARSSASGVGEDPTTQVTGGRRRPHKRSTGGGARGTPMTPMAPDTLQAVSAINAAQQAAARAAEKLAGQQPTSLLQHCRQLLIACKSSNTGQELITILSALPDVLGPASQLRTMQVSLSGMSAHSMQAALQAGVDIAAAAIAVLDKYAEGGGGSPHTVVRASVTAGASGTTVGTLTGRRSTAPALPSADTNMPLTTQSQQELQQSNSVIDGSAHGAPHAPAAEVSQPREPTQAHSRSRPALSVSIPPVTRSPDLDTLSAATSQPLLSPSMQGTGATAGVFQGPQGWEAHASVMVVDDPADPLWLEGERLKQQKGYLETVLEVWDDGVQLLLLDLPTPEMNGAVPALSDRPHLLGCCNPFCRHVVPGRGEREVALKRCEQCQRVWYCSDECREAAAPRHKVYCHWSAAMI